MNVGLTKSNVDGIISAPPSKSGTQRAFMAALLRNGISIISNTGKSDDERSALRVIKQLGATVFETGNQITIHSQGLNIVEGSIHVGESGLCARLLGSILAISNQTMTLDGAGSLKQRSIRSFEEFLPVLGVSVRTTKGCLPMILKGPLKAKDLILDGSLSSQYLSGLLFAYSYLKANGVTIEVKQFVSKPYIHLTLAIMEYFGFAIPEVRNGNQFHFRSLTQKTIQDETVHYTVEGDWSNAAFMMVAAAISGSLRIKNLQLDSFQADKAILLLLKAANVDYSILGDTIEVKKSTIQSFHFDATDCPDLFPPAVVLAAFSKGVSYITGVSRLHNKESNRAIALQMELSRLGVMIEINNDVMSVEGKSLRAAVMQSHNDHRIAMACSIAAIGVDGMSKIESAECVAKSYPNFYDDLRQIGVEFAFFG